MTEECLNFRTWQILENFQKFQSPIIIIKEECPEKCQKPQPQPQKKYLATIINVVFTVVILEGVNGLVIYKIAKKTVL